MQEARMAVVVDAYGCSAHLLNLIGQDLADQNVLNKVCVMSQVMNTKLFLSQVLEVAKHFRKKDYARWLSRDTHIVRAPLPSETRWNAWSLMI